MPSTIRIATRGSALAMAQTTMIQRRCEAAFPDLKFEAQIIRTTGDKLQTISLTNPNQTVTKGLFTKELEVALLDRTCDFAVHSLKDLPTELPDGLTLGAVPEREDVRDVLIYRAAGPERQHAARGLDAEAPLGLEAQARIADFPSGATIATSSTRRQAQLLALRPDLRIIPIRGNVGTRLQKLTDHKDVDGVILAAAGLKRLDYQITPEGTLGGCNALPGLNAVILSTDEMLPCVGQAALGIEVRENDPMISPICDFLTDPVTRACVLAERAFLRAMGGGCLSPVAAYAQIVGGNLSMAAVSFRGEVVKRGVTSGPPNEAETLGAALAAQLM